MLSSRYGHNAKVVHFLGKVKPWHHSYDAQRGEVKGHSPPPALHQLQPDYLLTWWQLYYKSVVPLLQRAYGDAPFCSGLAEPCQEVRGRGLNLRLCVCVCVSPYKSQTVNYSCLNNSDNK